MVRIFGGGLGLEIGMRGIGVAGLSEGSRKNLKISDRRVR